MGRSSSIAVVLVFMTLVLDAFGGSFSRDVTVTFGGDQRAKILNGGQLINLSLDRTSGAGFQSNDEYLFGRFDIEMKLAPGNSAGTVTTFYLSSQGPTHDEIDFEFLGNVSGQPYTLQTNVFSQGKGNREQQLRLWFDPTNGFHTYSIVWNPQNIIFLVDHKPIRVFANHEAVGVPFPKNQPMRVYCTIWDGENWATEGGRVKTDWGSAPFTASYQNFNINACVAPGTSPCGQAWQPKNLDPKARNSIRWAQQRFVIYDFCADRVRFHHRPRECRGSRF